jgi:hypothetical protein
MELNSTVYTSTSGYTDNANLLSENKNKTEIPLNAEQ